MTSIERTAYPRFRKLITVAELRNHFGVSPDEAAWAGERTDSEPHLLGLVLLLKCFVKMGRFPGLGEVPDVVVDFVRRGLELPTDTVPVYGTDRSERAHKALIRERVGVRNDQKHARAVAEAAMRAEAAVKNNPPDLINVALEKLTESSLEFPAYSTLDNMCGRVRREVNRRIFRTIYERLTPEQRVAVEALLTVKGSDGRSEFDRLKRPAGAPTWTHLREQVSHLRWVDSFGGSGEWMVGIAAGKIADFAGEAAAGDAGVLGDYERVKRIALLACLIHQSRGRARDDLATMFCKRVAIKVKRAKSELEDIRTQQRQLNEGLVAGFKTLLRELDPHSVSAALRTEAADLTAATLAELGAAGTDRGTEAGLTFARLGEDSGPQVAALLRALKMHETGLGAVVERVEELGGFAAVYADIDTVSATYGDLHELLVARHLLVKDRRALFEVTDLLTLTATSDDDRVLRALAHAKRYRDKSRDFIADRDEQDTLLDAGFASEKWQKVIRDPTRPDQFDRRHFEACVFVNLAEELRTGDVAVDRSGEYADWNAQLLDWATCEQRLPAYLVEVGMAETLEQAAAFDAKMFRTRLQSRLTTVAASADSGFPDNDDLTIDPVSGIPSLNPYKRREHSAAAQELAELLQRRMPERSLLGIVSRTAYWLEWWRRFGPASGSDPKITDPFGRYVITTFVYGANMGAAEAARHILGISAHELSTAAGRHASIAKLNDAITDVVNGHARLDLVRAWGDGTVVGADGTHVETWLDNLLAETSVRYGKSGGIAYHHISDFYVALFTHFVPCGVWEAVYIIEGLLKNASEVKPTTVHADTQGQSYPIYTLAHLMGFELMPRVRNWKELRFYRPTAATTYRHIDVLFDRPGRNVIDWALIEKHYRDLMRVAISIRDGRISSSMLMRRLSSNSRRNHVYRAFREVGKVIRTVQLLRFLSDARCGAASPRPRTRSSPTTTSPVGCGSARPGSSPTTIPTSRRNPSNSINCWRTASSSTTPWT